MHSPRREFLKSVAQVGIAAGVGAFVPSHWRMSFGEGANSAAKRRGESSQNESCEVIYPRGRIPLSFIIDDSTCLVNMGHYCMPQFATAWPDREVYDQPWRDWPREIPDAFVREFGEWCAEHGVKGKYSIVPNPACVGWLDRELPGWSLSDLRSSLSLVRDLMMPNWDIHPEMITHTRVIDLKTGRPMEEINAGTMENSYPQEDKSVDELAEYLAYALRILQRCDLPCEGITTPGGFGNRVKSELSLAVMQAVRDVDEVEIPHYFKYVHSGDESTEPIIENLSRSGDQVDLVVNVPAGTGDWFGGWEGVRPVEAERYANRDATEGRMVELIERGQPAIMLCHWPGMYNNGTKEGLHAFQQVVIALHERFGGSTQWMKLSEIARYWATKETAQLDLNGTRLQIDSPFACPELTVRVDIANPERILLRTSDQFKELSRVQERELLVDGSFLHDGESVIACVSIPQGSCSLSW